jgi:hypothetical protein
VLPVALVPRSTVLELLDKLVYLVLQVTVTGYVLSLPQEANYLSLGVALE